MTAIGISYTSSAPGMTTAAYGYFAAGVMKSETAVSPPWSPSSLSYSSLDAV